MTTLNELVEVIASVEGLDLANARLVARRVREDGLITSSGRGPYAAHMTEKDAAALLIAFNIGGTIVQAPKGTARYANLEARDLDQPVYDDAQPAVCGTLGQAIATLLNVMRNHELPDTFLNCPVSPTLQLAFEENRFKARLTLRRPMPLAELILWSADSDDPPFAQEPPSSPFNLQFRSKANWRTRLWKKTETGVANQVTYDDPAGPDRMDFTQITDRTLRAVAEALGPTTKAVKGSKESASSYDAPNATEE